MSYTRCQCLVEVLVEAVVEIPVEVLDEILRGTYQEGVGQVRGAEEGVDIMRKMDESNAWLYNVRSLSVNTDVPAVGYGNRVPVETLGLWI
jgi:hypothetical protein